MTDAGGRSWVLRRPPLGHVLATAHDMGREHRIISALAPTDVPVAPVVGLCTDEDVNGAPFYVMGFVDGLVARDRASAEHLGVDQRRNASRQLAEVLASIHAVDPDAVGLGELGRREGYIERQLRRWYGQWQSSKTRDLDVVDEVHDALAARVPEQGRATIVHGDYRLDNCLLEPGRHHRRGARLGALHARRSAGRRGPAARVLDRAGRRAPGAAGRGHACRGLRHARQS